jgi:cytochrome oxidase assembly protein ShyY1
MGNRIWQPAWPLLLLALAACALFIALGRWQWQRGEYRTAQWRSFTATDVAPRDADAAELAQLPRFTRVRLRGRFDGAHQFLLDNISEGGRAGYYVLTPLLLEGGAAVLVNRGWVAGSGYRENLPDVSLPAGEPGTVTGRIGLLPVAGTAAGRVPPPGEGPWPRVASFPTPSQLAAVLPYPLATTGVVLLDPAADPDATGLTRNWRPPGLEPARHYAYAVQWWAFAVLALVLVFILNLRRKTP